MDKRELKSSIFSHKEQDKDNKIFSIGMNGLVTLGRNQLCDVLMLHNWLHADKGGSVLKLNYL